MERGDDRMEWSGIGLGDEDLCQKPNLHDSTTEPDSLPLAILVPIFGMGIWVYWRGDGDAEVVDENLRANLRALGELEMGCSDRMFSVCRTCINRYRFLNVQLFIPHPHQP